MQRENAIVALVGEIAGVPGGKTDEIISEELTFLAKYNDGAIYIYTVNPPSDPKRQKSSNDGQISWNGSHHMTS